jgi:hypothetical protein
MRSLGVEFGETAIRKEGVGNASGNYLTFEDPSGNVSELLETSR